MRRPEANDDFSIAARLGKPAKAIEYCSGLYLKANCPFSYKHEGEDYRYPHVYAVVDKQGRRVFAGLMTMFAAITTVETLNTRAAAAMMTDDGFDRTFVLK